MNIIFFGDSICFGEKVSPHRTWVNKLSRDISREFGPDHLTINSSVNGDTTRLALERIPSDVQDYGVKVLILQFGMNDCNYWQTDEGVPRVSSEAFKYNLLEIMDRAKNFGAESVLLQTNHPTLRTYSFPHMDRCYERGNQEYNEIIRETSTMREFCTLNDIEEKLRQKISDESDLEKYLLEDDLHLSEAGHDLYYELVKPPLFDLLRSLNA